MIKEVVFRARLFETAGDRNFSRWRILQLLECLTKLDEIWLKFHPETPPLYQSGVVYAPEKGEIFRDIPTLIEEGNGDCDCLSCWRTAELRAIGVAAEPYIKWRREGDKWVYHALTRHPGGQIEDPSLALGMDGVKILARPVFVTP